MNHLPSSRASLLAIVASLSLVASPAATQLPSSKRGRPIIVFIHGRDQMYRTSQAIRTSWLEAFRDGVDKLRRNDGIGDFQLDSNDTRFVHYEFIYERDFKPRCDIRAGLAKRISQAEARFEMANRQVVGAIGAFDAAQTYIVGTSLERLNARQADTLLSYARLTIGKALDSMSIATRALTEASWEVKNRGYANYYVARIDNVAPYANSVIGSLYQAKLMMDNAPAMLSNGLQGKVSHAVITDSLRLVGDVLYSTVAPYSTTTTFNNDANPNAYYYFRANPNVYATWETELYERQPEDWPGLRDGTKRWLVGMAAKAGVAGVLTSILDDVDKYLRDWNYQCATNEVLTLALDSIAATQRPVIVVGHSMGSLVTYRVLHARDVARIAGPPVASFIALGSQLGIPEVMESLIGPTRPPYPYPRAIKSWTLVFGSGDVMAPLEPKNAFDTSSHRPFQTIITATTPGDGHDVVGYLKNIDAARAITKAWCGAFDLQAVGTRPNACRELGL